MIQNESHTDCMIKPNHTDQYLTSLIRDCRPRLMFQADSPAEAAVWQQKARSRFSELIRLPIPEQYDLEPCLLESSDQDGYRRERWLVQTAKGLYMPVYVLIPSQGPRPLPAVIACHGHGYGSREIVGLKHDGSPNDGDPGYQKNFALELVRRGFLVLAPDLFGFGDRRLAAQTDGPERAASSCHQLSADLLHLGRTMAGYRVWDVIRCIDFALTRPDADAARLGCMGISGGGLTASFASAADLRIAVTVVSGYASYFADSILSIHHCIDNYVPDLQRELELPDILALTAPRPLLIESGTRDDIFPIQSAVRAYEAVRAAYAVWGQAGLVDMDVFEGDHQISGVKAYPWLEKHLGPGRS